MIEKIRYSDNFPQLIILLKVNVNRTIHKIQIRLIHSNKFLSKNSVHSTLLKRKNIKASCYWSSFLYVANDDY